MALWGLINAVLGAYENVGDTVAYLDLSDAVCLHRWAALFNASWFPLYPAVLTVGRALFGFRPQYDLLAARLVDALLGACFIASAMVLAASIRSLMLARGTAREQLLPARTLYLWVATVAFIFLSSDVTGIKPDALVSAFMMLSLAALLHGIAGNKLGPFAAAGLCGGLAYWTKAFAFPFFGLMILLVAAVSLRNLRLLSRLAVSVAVFALVAGAYIVPISAAKGRFTIGDSGRLNSAWYVNHADRFNPVSDRSVYRMGEAQGSFKHPAELLAKDPEITYYGGDQVYGAMPQWDDFSYWSDGLTPRFNLRQQLAAFKVNLVYFLALLPMRLQALVLVAALALWGYSMRPSARTDPMLIAVLLLALASMGMYLAVHLEGRYIAFAFVILGALFAASCARKQGSALSPSLHTAVFLIASLVLVYSAQRSLREGKEAQGAHPLKGIFDSTEFAVGADLASRLPRGAEIACLGNWVCFDDMYWARYAGVKVTAVINTGHGEEIIQSQPGCLKLQQNPAALDLLRQRHVRGIVAAFWGERPCSTAWQPLGGASGWHFLPLDGDPITIAR
jgi:hypothetical protein